ncbi:MAG: M20/M25/M40 family metallo-hydrolase [Actinomycetota bacterium]|nr:M20/M25/M40 family metallo-hydrolase [Actinomycetota bacterium]
MRTARLAALLALPAILSSCAARATEDGVGGASVPGRESFPAASRAKLRTDLAALERIADRNGGNRATGTAGYRASVAYVVRELRAAGYQPRQARFSVRLFRELAPPVLRRVGRSPRRFRPGRDVLTFSYSGSRAATAPIQPVDLDLPPGRPNSSSSGCERSDFRGFRRGRIALLQRGRCFFWLKARNAEAAGARAALIFNEGQRGRRAALEATLGERSGIRIPVLGLSYAAGRALALAARRRPVVVRVVVRARIARARVANVVAELPGAAHDRVVMLGAHLDSVRAGPGINDNGSGTALVLDVARTLRRARTRTDATVRFAFWGGEELGLLGSARYVDDLGAPERDRIEVYLNFDMVASPNYARLLYRGRGVADRIERAFRDAFRRRRIRASTTSVGAASDHAPFARAGISVGGLFTGASGLKTRSEARLFGGRAGRPYDGCYHRACDRLRNVDLRVLEQMTNAALAATLALARSS